MSLHRNETENEDEDEWRQCFSWKENYEDSFASLSHFVSSFHVFSTPFLFSIPSSLKFETRQVKNFIVEVKLEKNSEEK